MGPQAPKEAVEQLREEMGLNDPVLVQYGRYMLNALKGDLGRSYSSNEKVSDMIASRFPLTLQLAIFSTVVAIFVGVPVGIISAVKKNSFFDHGSMIIVLIAISMPSFWLGLLLMLLFSVTLGWLPSGGYINFTSLILPSVTLGLPFAAILARMTRQSLLEEIGKDYVLTAEAKGLSRDASILKHALKNSLMPVITVIGMQFATQLGGSVIAENVFSLAGVGNLMVNAINSKDLPVVLGSVLLLAVVFCIANLIVDIIQAIIDPRVRSEYA